MSDTPLHHESSENHVRTPLWRTLINLAIAAIMATLAPFLICLLIFPLVLVLGALSDNALPAMLKDLINAVGTTSFITFYFGSGLILCLGVQFVILGIPTAILGWRLGLINQQSSISVGFLIGCLPWALLISFGILVSFGSNSPLSSNEILIGSAAILLMGLLGAFEGFIFWHVWQFLSNRSVPTQRAVDSGDSPR